MSDDPTPYASTGTALLSNSRIFSTVKPPEAVPVERVAHLPDEPLVHAGGLEVAQLVEQRPVDERLRRVEPDAPQPRPERAGHLERRLDGVVLEVDQDGDVRVRRRPLRE